MLSAIVAYCLSSILMTLVNKFVLSQFDFNMVFLMLAVQSSCCVALVVAFRAFGLVKFADFDWDKARQWWIVSFALVVMIYTGSKSLQYLPVPLFTIFKNITIIFIAFGERTLLKGSPVTQPMLISFFMMILSSVLGGWSNLSSSEPSKYSTTVGYLWMLTNCASSAGFALLMRGKIKAIGMKDFDTVFYNNALSIPILAVFSLVLEAGDWISLMAPSAASESSSGGLVTAILLSGIAGFAVSYSSSWCVRVTSSTTYSMVGALNKLPIAISGIIFFKEQVTTLKIVSIAIAFSAGLLYSWAKTQQQQEKYAPVLPMDSMKEDKRTRDM